MSRHDYSQNTVSNISSCITSMQSCSECTSLSIENMPYSWDEGIINTVVQWFEVMDLFNVRSDMTKFFHNSSNFFNLTMQEIDAQDEKASRKIDEQIEVFKEVSKNLTILSDRFSNIVSIPKLF